MDEENDEDEEENDSGAADGIQWDHVSRVLSVVNGRWSLVVMRYLDAGRSRPADLHARINAGPDGTISRKVMLEVLERLIGYGVVTRKYGAVTRKEAPGRKAPGWTRASFYSLTSEGRETLMEVSALGGGRPKGGWMNLAPGSHPDVPELDTAHAHSARILDYWLGGKDNFEADREAGDATMAMMPWLPAAARQARRFQGNAVTRLVTEHGVRQFLDIGTGLPTAGATHEVAQQTAPESRVVYADNDPLVLVHAQALLTSTPEGSCSYAHADLRDPAEILRHAKQTLDLTKPVAVLLVAVLHFISDEEDPWAIARQLLDAIRGPAYLVISHGASDLGSEAINGVAQYNQRSTVQAHLRPRDAVERFFDGMEILPPGLTTLGRWLPPEPGGADFGDMAGHVGIGRQPAKGAPLQQVPAV